MIKEIYRDVEEEFKIKLEASEISSTRKKRIERKAVRLYSDGKIGIAGVVGKADLEEIERKAWEKLEFGIEYKGEPTENLERSEEIRCHFENEDDLKTEFEYVLNELKSSHPNFLYNGHAVFKHSRVELENEVGLRLSHSSNSYGMTFRLKRKDSANMLDGYLWTGGFEYRRDETLELFEKILSALERDVELPKKEKMRVLFSTSDGAPIFIFYKDLHALKFATGGSLFSGKMGEKLFSEKFTLYQTRNHEDGFEGPFFDMEGTVVEGLRYTLVENGVLKSPFTSKKYAVEYGYDLTGAAGGDFDSVPDVEFPKLFPKFTHDSIEDISGDEAIFVLVGAGGDFTPEGAFSLPVQIPLLYKDGEFVGKLPPLRLRSNVWKMFGEDFIGVSRERLLSTDPGSGVMALDMEISKEI